MTDDYDQLNGLDSRIQKLQQASELLRKALGFVLLYRRLDAQMKEAIPNYAQEDADGGKMGTVTESPDEAPAPGQGQASEAVGELARAAGTLKAIGERLMQLRAHAPGKLISQSRSQKTQFRRAPQSLRAPRSSSSISSSGILPEWKRQEYSSLSTWRR